MIFLEAAAKINLCLKVIGKREDGYHEIDSIMQSVSLFDEIKLVEEDSIKIFCSNPSIPTDETNTAHKAARVFFEKTGIKKGVRVEIKKNIPEAAGLAGGSADAAAVFVGLNKLFGTRLSESELKTLGEEVGSDVPFCIIGGTCRIRGRGELVTSIAPLPKSWFIIVTPRLLISTAWVYQNFDRLRKKAEQSESVSITSLRMFNDLERVVFWKYQQIEELKKNLVKMGSLQALMSGSGSSVFGLVPSKEQGQKMLETLRKDYPQSYLVENVNFGVRDMHR